MSDIKNFFQPKSFLKEIILRFWAIIGIGFLCFSIMAGWIYHSTSRLHELSTQFEHLQQTHLRELLNTRDFFVYDLNNVQFYQSGKSNFLENVKVAHDSFDSQLKKINGAAPYKFKKIILDIAELENQYFRNYSETTEDVKRLGFKDWGLEGEWRKSIHELEAFVKSSKSSDKYLIEYLQLRRDEKDFLLRRETKYLQAMDDKIDQLRAQFSKNKLFGIIKIASVENYRTLMKSYVKVLEDVSIKKLKLSKIENELDQKIRFFRQNLRTEIESQNRNIFSLIGFFFLFLISVFYISVNKQAKSILEPIQKMKEHFLRVGHGDFDKDLELGREDEFLTLQNEFNLMLSNLRNSRAQAKMIALGEASATIAHDIASPLSILLGFVQILEQNCIDKNRLSNMGECLDQVQALKRSAERIQNIIGSVNKMSRQEISQEFKRLNIRAIIDESLFFITFKARNKDVKIQFLVPERDFYVLGNETLLSQAFVNLISNSIDAVERLRDRWIRISVYEVEDEIEITFTDSGLGIPREIQDNLFKVSMTTKDYGKGTGLGLMITKRIIDQHSGTIFVKDSENTCFAIRLPNEL